MSNATFSRKPLVAAVLTTLAVFSAGAMAEPVNKDVKLTVGTGANTVPNTIKDEKTWDEDWAKTFNKDFTNASGKVTISTGNGGDKITISKGTDDKTSGKLTNKLSSLTLNVGLDVAEGGTFVNNGTLKTSADLTVTGGLDNAKGKIEVTGTAPNNKANVRINGLTVNTDLESAPASVVMGDITLTNATLTNYDKGYTLKTEAEKKEGEADRKPETRARVSYGNVTLKTGGKFVNFAEALDTGSSLTIASDADTAAINGKSTWGTIKAQKENAVTVGDKGTLSADVLEYGYDAGNTAKISDLVSVTGGGKFTVNKGLIVSSFANGGSFDLSKAENKYLASGASLTFGKAQAFEQGEDGKIDDGDYHKGTVTLSGYKADWKVENATSKTGTEGDAETEKNGSWDVTKFGSVTVYNNAQLTIENNKVADFGDHGYTPSLSLGSLTLNSTSLKVTPSVKVATLTGFVDIAVKAVNALPDSGAEHIDISKLGLNDWTKDNYATKLEELLGKMNEQQLEAFKTSYDANIEKETNKLAIDKIQPTNATQTIKGSDVAIGSITFATVERSIEADTSKVVTSREGEGAGDNTPADRGSVTVDAITQAMGTQTLEIKNDSRVEVGSLSLADGTLHITDSDVIIHKTDKINGTLTAESGYLGLNVATTMADKVKADTPSTTGTTPNFVLEVGAPVVFGEDAKVTFGGVATTKTADTNPDAQAPKYGAQLTFAGDTTLKFDAANFNRTALFTAEGLKGKITNNGKVTLDGDNLTWGAYKLFENFEQKDAFTTAEGKENLLVGNLTAADAWKNQVGNNFEIKQNSDGDWMIVAGGTSVEGSGLNVSAKNLVSKIFAGERSTGPDTQLINQILSTGASLQEISSMINSVTGLGAISGVKAMTVDFQGYTADMIEHHAATMPKEMGGWWVQPMGARLKTDDLSMGGSAYGYSLDTYGIMGGFDTHLKNGWTIGAAASYQSGDADGEGDVLPVSTDVKNVGLHLWGSRMYGETNVIGTLSYVTTDGDVTMQLGNLELASELKAKALSAGIRAEREFKTGAFTLTPHAGARLSIVDMDDYEIAAGTTKLFDVSEDKATIFEVPVGVTVQTPSFMFQTFEVKPYVDVTLRGRFGDTESSYTLEGSSTTDTIDYDVSGSFVGDLKVGYMSTYKNLNLGMSYGLSAGDAGRQNHAIEATMRVDF